jgi:hypothetical protein
MSYARSVPRRWFWGIILVIFCLCPGILQAAPKKHCISPGAASRYLSAQTPSTNSRVSRLTSSALSAGNVVVVQADKQLLILSNPFDLQNRGIHFAPVLRNRYVYTVASLPFDSSVTDGITLKDDDSVQFNLHNFQFPFAGKTYGSFFINSNGNITFGEEDSDPPDLDTLLDGAPRIAPFFTDLDPESQGDVFVHETSDRVAVTWLKVPEFFNDNQFDFGENTFQVVLHSDGSIDFVYTKEMTATEAVVGILPGFGKSGFGNTRFSRSNALRPQISFIENYHDYESVNIPLLMQTLYKQYPDQYDFVTLFSNFDLNPVPGVQAFALVVQNDVKGIGNPAGSGGDTFRDTHKYGSKRKLQGITFFGNIHQFPTDPNQTLPDTYTSFLQMKAHETAHRWLAYIGTELDGRFSDVILGRDSSHWSFFLNSEGSFLEGNQVQQNSRSSFTTSTPFVRFSDLDLYLMGLVSEDDVTDTYFVDGARNFSPNFPFAAQSSPEPDVQFKGSAIPVRISDIIAANGKRVPDSTTSQKSFRDLFVLITRAQNPAVQQEIDQVDLFRGSWESYFSKVTNGKATISTKVQ